ncbi:MAG: GNAT family N-acetyltransferase [Formivibrio sp.]|nr:GNAT family N-acetyltransferase [Formivibrio sp.]
MSQSLPYKIRPIQADDAACIQAIQAVCYPPELLESTQALLAKCALSPHSCWLAENDQGVLAYLLTHPWHEDDLPTLNRPLDILPEHANIFFLHDLAVTPSSRNRGIAQELVLHAMHWAKEKKCRKAMLIAVQGAQKFWQHHGFTRQTSPSLVLQKKLNGYGQNAAFMIAEIG